MEAFVGSWQMTKSEGFDDVMKALGVGFLARVAGNTLKPKLVFSANPDGTFTMESVSTFKTTKCTFTLGEEFDETTPDGRAVRSRVTLDGTTMRHVQVGDKKTIIDRSIEGNAMMTVSFFPVK